MDAVRELCKTSVVMNVGKIIAAGETATVLRNPEVIKAYLETPSMHNPAKRASPVLLEASALSVSYGRHQALVNAAIQVAAGEVVVILGANGAGKTTLLSALMGMVPPLPNFSLTIDGKGMGKAPTHALVEAGLALVPSGRGFSVNYPFVRISYLGRLLSAPEMEVKDDLERFLAYSRDFKSERIRWYEP